MRKTTIILFIFVMIFTSSMLAACAPASRGSSLHVSWPGVTIDEASSAVFVSYNSHLYALNLDNGTEKWRFPAEVDKNVSLFAPPTLTNDGQLVVGGYDAKLYSLDPQTGMQNWVFDRATDKFIAPVQAADGLILAPNNDGNLYALDTNGSLKWTFKVGKQLWAKPLTDGERIYLASMNRLIYALDPASGEQIWVSEDLGGAVVNSFALNKGVIYAGTVGEDLIALEPANGEILWRTHLDGWVWSYPQFSDDSIFLADQEGYVYSLKAGSGELNWKIQPNSENNRGIVSTPVLVEDTLYFASEAGILYSVDAASGSTRWSKTIGGKIFSDLHRAGEQIVFAVNDFDSLVMGLDFQGNNRWSFIPSK
jgi:outer membrane protein assembly factor BamB